MESPENDIRRPSVSTRRGVVPRHSGAIVAAVNDFIIVSVIHKIIADGKCMLLASRVQRFSLTGHLMSLLSTDLPAVTFPLPADHSRDHQWFMSFHLRRVRRSCAVSLM